MTVETELHRAPPGPGQVLLRALGGSRPLVGRKSAGEFLITVSGGFRKGPPRR